MYFKSSSRTTTKSTGKKLLKGFVYLEIAAFVGTYLTWKKLNNSQEFRYFMSKNIPIVLETYYQIGERIGGLKTREYDRNCWLDKEKRE